MADTGSKNSFETFVKGVAKRADSSVPNSRKFIQQLFSELGDELIHEDRIVLTGIGIFKKKFVKKTSVYNPQKGKKISVKSHNRVSFKPSSGLAGEVNRRYRHLKPNVLDEMKAMTGFAKKGDESQAQRMTPERKKAKKRAVITLVALATLSLIFLAGVIFIPAAFKKSDAEAIQFVRELNAMMGLQEISDRLSKNLPETINEESLGRYIGKIRKSLSQDRKISDTHIVQSGDTIYSISKKYWGNKYLWPDLYYLNKEKFEDPNMLRPGDKIVIYEPLGEPKTLPPAKRRQLVEAYITMYRVSRALGEKEIAGGLEKKGEERIRESRWTLYTAVRYERKVLDLYEDGIYPEDREIVDDYISRFGYGDGSRRWFWGVFD